MRKPELRIEITEGRMKSMKCDDCNREMKSTREYTIELTKFACVQILRFKRKMCRTCLSKRKKRQKI